MQEVAASDGRTVQQVALSSVVFRIFHGNDTGLNDGLQPGLFHPVEHVDVLVRSEVLLQVMRHDVRDPIVDLLFGQRVRESRIVNRKLWIHHFVDNHQLFVSIPVAQN